LLILDDLADFTKDQAETSVLFELISAPYERRSLLITANQPFGECGEVFPDQAMTVAIVNRLSITPPSLRWMSGATAAAPRSKRKRGRRSTRQPQPTPDLRPAPQVTSRAPMAGARCWSDPGPICAGNPGIARLLPTLRNFGAEENAANG
jgi:hypothetical protein